MRARDEKPLRGDFGLVAARIIASGDPYRSTLFYRISTEGAGHMPQIGPRLVDPVGVAAVRDWIASLPPASARNEPVHSPEFARQRTAILEGPTEAQRAEASARLLGSMNGALALVDWCAGQAPGPLLEAARTAARSHTNVLVRDLLQRLLPPAQRRQTLGTDLRPEAILEVAGDAARGRELFHGVAQCAQCHVCEGRGRLFGPDLAAIGGKYQRAALLEQILAPSKVVAPEYKICELTLRDDSELRGFILRRTATELVLRDEAAAEHTVKLSEVKETRESNLSAMPGGLLGHVTAQQAADLLA